MSVVWNNMPAGQAGDVLVFDQGTVKWKPMALPIPNFKGYRQHEAVGNTFFLRVFQKRNVQEGRNWCRTRLSVSWKVLVYVKENDRIKRLKVQAALEAT